MGSGLFAQNVKDSTFIDKGLLRTFGCFAFDYRMNQNNWDYRLHGFIEYYAEKKVSLMGEFYQYLDSKTDFPVIKNNWGVGLGVGYHWSKKNLDPYVFYMGGGNIYTPQVMQADSIILTGTKNINTKLNPAMALGAGVNLYVWKYLHFFIQCRYTHTFLYSDITIQNMDSFSVSYGLGLNIQTNKKKKP